MTTATQQKRNGALKGTVSRDIQHQFAADALKGILSSCPKCGQAIHGRRPKPGTWCAMFDKFARYWHSGAAEYSVFVKGNDKLPFHAFSSLPGFSCPGAGECLDWCYSFKAWRYPAAFFRQLQNALLLQSEQGRQRIAAAWHKLPVGQTVRLYVDGDMDSLATMRFWWSLLKQRQDLAAYGYSKSWGLFLGFAKTGEEWPANYTLNLSSGSKYGEAVRLKMEALPIVRGDFIAVPAEAKMPNRREAASEWAEWAKALKASAKAVGLSGQMFVCPGKCGDCLPKGEHACGSDRFQGVKVLIGIH